MAPAAVRSDLISFAALESLPHDCSRRDKSSGSSSNAGKMDQT